MKTFPRMMVNQMGLFFHLWKMALPGLMAEAEVEEDHLEGLQGAAFQEGLFEEEDHLLEGEVEGEVLSGFPRALVQAMMPTKMGHRITMTMYQTSL